MELGIGMFGDLAIDKNTGKIQDTGEKLREILEEVKLADEVGLDVFGMGEHHRPDYAVSSPEILLAAAASVTKNIKLMSTVTVLSSSEPVNVYQNFSTIDQISGGRAEIGVGRGSFIESFPLFGYNLKDYDALFEEKLDLLLKINTQEKVSWKGTLRPPMVNQTVYPRAVNNGQLPIWIAVGGTPESILRAAKLGLPLILAIIGGMPAQFKPHMDFYKEQYLKHGHDPAKMQLGIHSHTFVSDNEAICDGYFENYAAQMDRIGSSRGWAPYTKHQFNGGRSKDGALFIGDPSAVTDKILHMHELFGITRFIAHMDVGAPDHKLMMKSIELFGTKVAPEIRKALQK
ncbi:Luciferase-like, subgroup [Leadbetterella byssophila DSM 17132]|uniref:Luciferase-like, subgroup n=1 Tax=Leadbetterella byssophila (strain DSM 17132 / JCM 16389 / KACC 11308 / NBRC 106382 / 4M15) TaxID=649349 RepID=E4RZ13_LEAB4|nr:LLM class flavin-dependent oxidoreductase [Leadbetterella byssophila]ADQ18232.1 Luciferase-like, subgroup [Leadbetterella byssophila DSM 17132]